MGPPSDHHILYPDEAACAIDAGKFPNPGTAPELVEKNEKARPVNGARLVWRPAIGPPDWTPAGAGQSYFLFGIGWLPVAVLVSLPGVPAVPAAPRAVLAIISSAAIRC